MAVVEVIVGAGWGTRGWDGAHTHHQIQCCVRALFQGGFLLERRGEEDPCPALPFPFVLVPVSFSLLSPDYYVSADSALGFGAHP